MRSNHGPYNVTLDGQLYQDNGYYGGDLFQQVLFSADGLDGTKPHTVSIINSQTNPARPYLDVDSVSAIPVARVELELNSHGRLFTLDCLSD